MIRKLSMAGALVALLVPTISNAQQAAPPPPAGGFTFAARIGYAPAMGDAASGVSQSTFFTAQIPIQVDALYRFTPEFAAGAYFSYGFSSLSSDLKDLCALDGGDCSARTLRYGVEGTYTITNASSQFSPWFGLGIGWESTTLKETVYGVSGSASFSGLEFLNLQAGGDFRATPQFSVGPYVMLSIAQYSDVEGQSITDKGTHEWFHIGIRGKFDL